MSFYSFFFYDDFEESALRILKKIIAIKNKKFLEDDIIDESNVVSNVSLALKNALKNVLNDVLKEEFPIENLKASLDAKSEIENAIAEQLAKDYIITRKEVSVPNAHAHMVTDAMIIRFIEFPSAFSNVKTLTSAIQPVMEKQKDLLRVEYERQSYRTVHQALLDYSQAQAGCEWLATLYRIFKGHWGNHHGAAVAKYLLEKGMQHIENQLTLEVVINDLQEIVPSVTHNGTLEKILQKATRLKP